MGKKRKHDEEQDNQVKQELFDTLDDSQIAELAEPEPKRQKNDEELLKNMESLPTDKIDIWLVKKPKNVSIEALNEIRLPKKFKENNRDRQFATSEGQLRCLFERPANTMVHFQAPKVIHTVKDKSALPVLDRIRGVAVIQTCMDIEDPFPEFVEEDYTAE
ncbi:hypothetical protein M3Y97_01127800 [Aphelenchoides bicaudatus]|nr:hypothetical protein M3Y97_01127800 [Aphelenchoides bicaudatus]